MEHIAEQAFFSIFVQFISHLQRKENSCYVMLKIKFYQTHYYYNMAILLCHVVTVQDVQNNRSQVYALLRSVLNESHRDSAPRALHSLSLHSQFLSHFYFRYKLYVVFKKIPCVFQLRRAAFHTRYFIFYRSLNRSALYTPFSSIFRKLSFTAATSSW